MTSYIDRLKGWIAQPFSTEMSVTGWALFTGLIMVAIILWTLVLKDLRGDL